MYPKIRYISEFWKQLCHDNELNITITIIIPSFFTIIIRNSYTVSVVQFSLQAACNSKMKSIFTVVSLTLFLLCIYNCKTIADDSENDVRLKNNHPLNRKFDFFNYFIARFYRGYNIIQILQRERIWKKNHQIRKNNI